MDEETRQLQIRFEQAVQAEGDAWARVRELEDRVSWLTGELRGADTEIKYQIKERDRYRAALEWVRDETKEYATLASLAAEREILLTLRRRVIKALRGEGA